MNQPQLVTDALVPYADAMADCFGEAAHGMLNQKAGGLPSVLRGRAALRQAPTNPVERANLTVRTQLRPPPPPDECPQ